MPTCCMSARPTYKRSRAILRCVRAVLVLCSPKDTIGNQIAVQVLERVFNKAPVYYRNGGTIPALAYFQSILGVNTTGFGFGLGDHIHAPNERTPVKQYHVGRIAFVEMLSELGQQLPRSSQAARKGRRRKKGSKTSEESLSLDSARHDPQEL